MNAFNPIAACLLAVLAGACSQTQTPMIPNNATAKIVVLQSGAWGNVERAVARLREVLAEVSLKVSIERITVSKPAEIEKHRFLGSPTIQIGGLDIDPGARARTEFAPGWRVYDGAPGVPPKPMILNALREAGMLKWLC